MKAKDKKVQEAWQEFWASRRSSPEEIYPNSPRLVNLILRSHGSDPVLEVGGGSSRDSIRLARQGKTVVVLDLAESALKMAQGLAAERDVRIGLIRGDARALPFRDSAFGTVFHQGVLEHFDHPTDLVNENVRVLRPDGLLLIDVPQTFHPWTVLKHILIPLGLWFGGPETQFTPAALRKLVESAGLEVMTEYGEWMHPSLVYRLAREAGRKSSLWHLPLYPKWRGLIGLWRKLDVALFKGKIELWTGYVVGVLACKRSCRS